MKKLFKSLIIISLVLVSVITSCVSQKKILLLQKEQMLDDITSVEYQNKRSFDYKVQPGDILYIRVSSLDKDFLDAFDMGNSNSSMAGGGGSSSGNPGIYLNGYNVSDEGQIEFMYAGKIYVKDLTIDEIQQKIQNIIGEYQKETIVYVKLGLFNLTILGEVARPGQYQVYQSDINLFQAMALAGNLTDFANKKNVKIVHQTTEGSQIVRVNLNDADILSSPEYYLKPNDIIYVEPLKIKRFGFETFPYGMLFSAISMLLTLYTFFMITLK